jgi:hypothetical protein
MFGMDERSGADEEDLPDEGEVGGQLACLGVYAWKGKAYVEVMCG